MRLHRNAILGAIYPGIRHPALHVRAMERNRNEVLIAATAIGVSFTWFSAWLTGLLVDPGSWPLRYALFGLGFLVAVALTALWMAQVRRSQRLAQSYFDAMARIDPAQLATADLPVLPESNPWCDAAQRIHAMLTNDGNRALEAEHARAALEVRTQRLRQEKDQVLAILDGLREPILAINQFEEVFLANPSAQALLGFALTKDGNRKLDELVDCPQLAEVLLDTQRRRTPTQRTCEIAVSGAAEENNWYSVVACTLPTAGAKSEEQAHGAVAVLRDISGHKAAQKRNAEFVSAVSHEMKTPLAGIKAYVELLADGDAEDEATREEFLNVINSQTDRLQRLIDNLLNLARIEAGVVNVNKHARSLNELLEEAFHVVIPSAEAKEIVLDADLSPMYLGVLVDRDMLLQAAINLLSNAIKYTPNGGEVTLRSRSNDNEVVFEVEDTGVGLDEEDREKVFQKFYRVRKDRKMAQGTGLGLPLAKHIVEDVHGGRLTVQSKLGQGSTFRITLPTAGQLTNSPQLVG
jgi:two-component system phosphate regulon sensor histidine kinase PhoR